MKIRLTRIVFAVLLSVPVTPAAGQTVAPVDSSRSALDAPLAPGDAIQLAFWREPQLGGDFPVDESGTVVLPLLGVRTVTQRSASDLKRTLLEEYAQQIRNQEVRITLLRRVRILGAVKNPGLYRVDPTMTVVDALAMAGGATEQGKLKGVRVYRDGKQVGSPLDLNARLVPQLRSGDQIVVPERSWFSRNGGYVVAAGISAVGIIVARVAP
jgi:protein involved in polysaccharide export with SLBB domain